MGNGHAELHQNQFYLERAAVRQSFLLFNQNVTLRKTVVPKGLCIVALTISIIVLALFLMDLIMGLAGMQHLAPFKYANMVFDIVAIVVSVILAVMSWFTFREQV